jgi:hypothetical protein
LKQEVGRLFWDVHLATSGSASLLFGEASAITVTVTDKLGTAIQGANVFFSSDWGSIDPPIAVTSADGTARVELVGLFVDVHPPLSDIGVLQRAVNRVRLISEPSTGAVQHNLLRFAPDEISAVSRYAPPGALIDLGRDIPPVSTIVPQWRQVTVTAHAKEGDGAIVRGVGSIQVAVGLWVRHWAQWKIRETIESVSVGARVGDLMRQGLGGPSFVGAPVISGLPTLYQAVTDDTSGAMKASVFVDAAAPDTEVARTGQLGQTIALEATASVGARVHEAINQQADQFAATPTSAVPADQRTAILQTAAQIGAGMTQVHKQTFAAARLGA